MKKKRFSVGKLLPILFNAVKLACNREKAIKKNQGVLL
jgi:hypothetical protein